MAIPQNCLSANVSLAFSDDFFEYHVKTARQIHETTVEFVFVIFAFVGEYRLKHVLGWTRTKQTHKD